MLINLEKLRNDYALSALKMEDTAADPYEQFARWMEAAIRENLPEPSAMALATTDEGGQPSVRMVLLKGVKPGKGFVFYTNYNSRKGQELIRNPKAAVVFYWEAMQRQVRIEASVEKIAQVDSETYFQSRPKGSQIGAIASPQSQVIPSRTELEQKVLELEATHKDEQKLPCPENWGGFILIPHRFEFWQGRSNRLHDRIQYRPDENGGWKRERLAP